MYADPEESPCELSEAIAPAICIPAHQDPPRANPWLPDTADGCINYFSLFCWPDPEIGCWTEGYGEAVFGECQHDFGESAIGFCFNGYKETGVVLQYHRSECAFTPGGYCECIWLIGGQTPQGFIVCDCAQI